MAVNINVPSQVKTYANLAAFPATGALKTIYIAEDTNKTYRWTGSVYTEISASAAMTWGAIGGTLSNQTDLQNALDAKVPTSRTLTINGVTQDLSADRTFTISTGITIGTTAITSGVVGRVLFQGTGNVVQQSSSLFWDNTNLIFTLGSTATRIFNFRPEDTTGTYGNSCSIRGGNGNGRLDFYSASNITEVRDNVIMLTSVSGPAIQVASYINLNLGGSTRLQVASTTGNVLINTTTDAGFKLDVNGTARVQSLSILSTGNFGNTIIRLSTSGIAEQIYNSGGTTYLGADNSAGGFLFTGGLPYASFFGSGGNTATQFGTNSAIRMTIFGGGNVGINTTTDAGYRLDVNGTTRVSGQFDVISGTANFRVSNSGAYVSLRIGATAFVEYNATEAYFLTQQVYFSGGLNFRFNGVGQFGFTGNPSSSAQLQVESTTKGFLPPRMTTTQKNAIASPAAGLMVYDTTLNVISYYNGSMWI